MQSLYPHKIGDTLNLSYSLPIDIGSTIASISCSVRTESNKLIDSFNVTQLADDTDYSNWSLIATSTQTATWPSGTLLEPIKLYSDLKHITSDGQVAHTETFLIPVYKAVTQ